MELYFIVNVPFLPSLVASSLALDVRYLFFFFLKVPAFCCWWWWWLVAIEQFVVILVFVLEEITHILLL